MAKAAGGGVGAVPHSPVQPPHPPLPHGVELRPSLAAPQHLRHLFLHPWRCSGPRAPHYTPTAQKSLWVFLIPAVWKTKGISRRPLAASPELVVQSISGALRCWVRAGPGHPAGTGTTAPTQLGTGSFAAPGELSGAPRALSLAHPAVYLLDQHIPFVQAQPVPQLPQHLFDRLVRAGFASVGRERHGDIYTEDVTLEQPGQPGGAHNCCREGKKKH